MENWWTEIEASIIECLEAHGATAPAEVGKHLGISESAAASFLSLLASEGKVRICLVERAAAGRGPRQPWGTASW